MGLSWHVTRYTYCSDGKSLLVSLSLIRRLKSGSNAIHVTWRITVFLQVVKYIFTNKQSSAVFYFKDVSY